MGLMNSSGKAVKPVKDKTSMAAVVKVAGGAVDSAPKGGKGKKY